MCLRRGLFLLMLGVFSFSTWANQMPFPEKIRTFIGRKRNIYLGSGVLYSGKISSDWIWLKKVRHSYNKGKKEERVVLDFEGNQLTQVYGYIAHGGQKLYLDVFNGGIRNDFQTNTKGTLVDKIAVYPIDEDMLSIEIDFKKPLTFDVFFLTNPLRLVIDSRL